MNDPKDPLTNKEAQELDKMVSAELEDWAAARDLLNAIADAVSE